MAEALTKLAAEMVSREPILSLKIPHKAPNRPKPIPSKEAMMPRLAFVVPQSAAIEAMLISNILSEYTRSIWFAKTPSATAQA